MRLIDADALRQELRKHQIESLIAHNEEENVFDIINEIPCAYDVYKVVEQLENLKDTMGYSTGCKTILKKTIEIVKCGGVNE